MEFTAKKFEELTLSELYNLLALRTQIFVVEQQCIYQDIDNKDQKAIHVLGKIDGQLVAYVRIFSPGDYFEKASMGRVAVHGEFRSLGLGKKIVLRAQKAVEEYYNTSSIELSAQTYLKGFYEDLGYEAIGEEYLEDGIPHIKMIKD